MKARREEDGGWIEVKWWSNIVRPLIVNRWKEQEVVIRATWGTGLCSA